MTATAITVLYDDTNPPSVAVFNKLNANVPMGKTLKPLKISDPKKFGPQPAMDGFMVIPNAMYYSHSAAIAAMVDGNANEIYYPEREYKNAHRKKNNVSVHGHHIQNTLRQAAGYVNRICSVRQLLNSRRSIMRSTTATKFDGTCGLTAATEPRVTLFPTA